MIPMRATYEYGGLLLPFLSEFVVDAVDELMKKKTSDI